MNKRGGSSGGSEGRRVQKVERELLFHLGRFLAGSYKGELPGIVTVTQVRVPPNLRSAKVFISVLNGTQEDQKLALEVLRDRRVEMQNYIGRELPMKFTPVLEFAIDEGLERSLRIQSILSDLDRQRKE